MTDGGVQPHGRESRERVLVETPVTAVGRGSRGPLVVTLLVVAAFAAGLLRPWDLVMPPGPSGSQPPGTAVATAAADATTPVPAEPTITPVPTPRPGTALALCGYPSTWRTMSRVWWSSRPATVWMAADVIAATGPTDPAITFTHIGDAPVMAIGWCAPVGDAERPPRDASASLFRLVGGVAQPVVRPSGGADASDPMGQLWFMPGVNPAPWPGGTYVIRLATPSGSWVRYLGLDVAGLDNAPLPSVSPSH